MTIQSQRLSMVEGNDSENNELQNKGVNVTSDSLPTGIILSILIKLLICRL